MGFLSGAIITALAGVGATLLFKSSVEEKEQRAEEERRRNTPCTFDGRITKEDFSLIAKKACKSVKRVSSFSVEGPVISAIVRSQSGISSWNFTIDFNDYGNITGKYWINKENSDSKIPLVIAQRMQEEITNKL